MEINLKTEQLQEVVAIAILQTMDEATRNTILTNAITSLLAPQEEYGSRRKVSALEKAFEQAVHGLAHQIAREQLNNDEAFKTRLRELIQAATTKALEEGSDLLVERIARAITNGLCSER